MFSASGCPPGWFGADCVQRCNCSNGGVCDSATGNCTCGLGWAGPHCDKGDSTQTFILFLNAVRPLLSTCFCLVSHTWSCCRELSHEVSLAFLFCFFCDCIFLFYSSVSQNVLWADLVPTASWNVTVKITALVTEWQGRVSVAPATMDICVSTVRTEQINTHTERQKGPKEHYTLNYD